MAYGKSNDLAKKTQSAKVLRDKAFTIASDPKYDVIKEDKHQWFTSFLMKNLVEVLLLMNQITTYQMSCINQLFEN